MSCLCHFHLNNEFNCRYENWLEGKDLGYHPEDDPKVGVQDTLFDTKDMIHQHQVFLKWSKKFVMDMSGFWTAYIAKTWHAIYAVSLPDIPITESLIKSSIAWLGIGFSGPFYTCLVRYYAFYSKITKYIFKQVHNHTKHVKIIGKDDDRAPTQRRRVPYQQNKRRGILVNEMLDWWVDLLVGWLVDLHWYVYI